MESKTFITAATSLALFNTIRDLKIIASIHGHDDNEEHINNMMMITMVGYCISTGKDKTYLLKVFAELIKAQQENEGDDIINQAIKLL
tara:strand:+ start:2958 stop:3221 length:264 start_codon:yes stop_codon:yes gene_type:complete